MEPILKFIADTANDEKLDAESKADVIGEAIDSIGIRLGFLPLGFNGTRREATRFTALKISQTHDDRKFFTGLLTPNRPDEGK